MLWLSCLDIVFDSSGISEGIEGAQAARGAQAVRAVRAARDVHGRFWITLQVPAFLLFSQAAAFGDSSSGPAELVSVLL